MSEDRIRHVDLWIARALTFGPVALAFPGATLAVFALGAGRNATADTLAVVYSVGLFAGFTTPLWPLPSLRGWTHTERVASVAKAYLVVSCLTHLSWELGWLVLHEHIAGARDAAWAYPWWAYIEGGDVRYATAPPELVMMEVLSVCNGLIGSAGLVLALRSRDDRRRTLGLLLCMATAVVHLYSTSLYFGTELLSGLPSVDTSSALDTWFKFGLANAPWIVFPWFVLAWAGGQILFARTPARVRTAPDPRGDSATP